MAEPKAPERAQFKNGLLENTADLDTETLTPSLRSYMDKGKSAFRNNPREISRIRENILLNLRQENSASRDDAEKEKNEHAAFTVKEMNPIVKKVKKSRKDAIEAKENHLRLKARLGGADAAAALKEMNDSLMAKKAYDSWSEGLTRFQQEKAEAAAAQAAPVPVAPAPAPAEQEAPELQQEGEAARAAAEEPGAREDRADEGQPGHEAVRAGEGQPGSGPVRAGEGQPGSGPIRAGEGQPGQGPNPAVGAQPQAPQQRERRPGLGDETRESTEARFDHLRRVNDLINEVESYNQPGYSVGAFKKRFYSRSAESAETKKNKLEAKANSDSADLIQQLIATSFRWKQMREQYRESTFRRRYNAYDNAASSYFKLTRTLSADQRTIGEASRKNIAEYVGVYDESEFAKIKEIIEADPDANIRFSSKPGKVSDDDSLNSPDPRDPLIKLHKTMVFQAFGEGISTLAAEQAAGQRRVRMKLAPNFRGYFAKSQYTDSTNTATDTWGAASPENRGKINEDAGRAGMTIPEMNLTAEEKGANGEYLVSEETARIQSAGMRSGRKEVRGIYDSGVFYSDQDVTGKSNEDFSSSTRWNEMDRAEKLRSAIRRSDYFRHINAGTIQYYMSYDISEDFNKNNASQQAIAGMDSQAVKDAFQKYVEYKNAPAAKKPELYTALGVSAVVAAVSAPTEQARHMGVILLSDPEEPLWKIARSMAENMKGKFGFGRMSRTAKDLPASGQVMRIGLLEEFAKDRSVGFRKAIKSPSTLYPDNFNRFLESAAARRGSTFSGTNIMRGLASGLLPKRAGDIYSTAASTANSIVTNGGDTDNPRAKFATDYGKLVSKVGDIPGAVVFGAVPLFATINMYEDGVPTDSSHTTMGIFSIVQNALEFVQNTISLVDVIRKDKEGDREKEKAKIEIALLIGRLLRLLVTCIKELVGVLGGDAVLNVGITGIVNNIFKFAEDTIKLVQTYAEENRLKAVNSAMNTGLTDYRAKAANDPNYVPLTDSEKLGKAASESSFAQGFLGHEEDRMITEQRDAKADMIVQSLDFALNVAGVAGAPVAYAFKPAEKIITFISWAIDKVHDYDSFKKNIATMMGDASFASYGEFDSVLERETGIKDRHYLMDVSRVFMAIDTHCLVTKRGKDDGERNLALKLMLPFLNMPGGQDPAEDEENLRKVKLKSLLDAVGAQGNWRAVLRSSITG